MTVRITSPTPLGRQAGTPDRPARQSDQRIASTQSRERSVMAGVARPMLSCGLLLAALALPAARVRAQGQGQPQGPALAAPAPAPAPAPAGNVAARHDFDELVDNIPDPLPDAPGQPGGWEPEFLKTLPNPPDQPFSMLAPPPPIAPPPPNLERYFEPDPLLDPPQWPQPGWFSDVQIGIVHPQVFFGQFKHSVIAGGSSHLVAPGTANYGWAVAPRIELGYRLPSGFGSFAISSRFFSAYGTGSFSGPAGTADRISRIGVNYWDYDYISGREYSPWTNWTLDWCAGVRTAFAWIGTVADQSFARAAAGHGVFIAGSSAYALGNGPHFGVVLERKFPTSGLAFVTKLDIADEFTRERDLFSASTTTLNAAGRPERGNFTTNFWNIMPILNFQVGTGWSPPNNPNIQLYMGYIYEYWWQVATNSNVTPLNGGVRGFFNNQGIVFQAQIKF